MKHPDIVSRMTVDEKCGFLSGKNFWQTRSCKRLGVESITLTDGPHGVRRQEGSGDQLGLNASLPATCYPTAATIANSWDPDLGEELGRHLGAEAVSQDVSVLLGPGLNIKRNPLCGRNFEYFSEDPYLSGKMAAAYIRGIQANGISACPKHFAANNVELRRMASDSVVDERTLREIYLTGFEIAVKEGHPRSIMSSYNRVNGVYAHENPLLLRDILRGEWGFDGIVVSDWGACNDIMAGVQAGSNLEMPGSGGDGPEQLVKALRAGRLSLDEVDQRVDELLDVVLSVREAADRAGNHSFDVEAHHAFAQCCSEESIVLLKNEDAILPLAPGAKVALIGEFARKARYQGAGSSAVNCTKLDHTLDVIGDFDLNLVGFEPGYPRHGAPDDAMIKNAVALARDAEIVLLYLGLDEISESEGLDRADMKLPECQIQLLEAVSAVNPNVVAVLSAGSAVEMPWLDRCRALVHGYLCGQAGARAVLRVLTGAVNPSGRLSETYPLSYADVPSAPYFPQKERTVEYREGPFVGYRYFETAQVPVAFPFGFGMSYTTFEYSNLRADARGVSFTLTNAGDRDGAEVAQLYVSARHPRVCRPAKELKGFRKVFLKAGERREVTIPLDDKAFRYWNGVTRRFEIDGGESALMVGASVTDIRLAADITVAGTDAPACEDLSRLPSYVRGDIKAVSDAEFAALLGHDIPDGRWSGAIQMNDAVAQLRDARSLKARLLWRVLKRRMDQALTRGVPDLNTTFVYNMPIRGIAKVMGGGVSLEMCEGILDIVNGHALGFIRGLARIAGGYLRHRRVRKKYRALE